MSADTNLKSIARKESRIRHELLFQKPPAAYVARC